MQALRIAWRPSAPLIRPWKIHSGTYHYTRRWASRKRMVEGTTNSNADEGPRRKRSATVHEDRDHSNPEESKEASREESTEEAKPKRGKRKKIQDAAKDIKSNQKTTEKLRRKRVAGSQGESKGSSTEAGKEPSQSENVDRARPRRGRPRKVKDATKDSQNTSNSAQTSNATSTSTLSPVQQAQLVDNQGTFVQKSQDDPTGGFGERTPGECAEGVTPKSGKRKKSKNTGDAQGIKETPSPTSGLTPKLMQQIKLRDYQEECINSVLSSVNNGSKRLGISLATGSGKTVIFTQLIDRVPPRSKHATQTLVLAHRRELVEQAAKHCTLAYPSKTIDIEMGNIHASGTADITIASIQSFCSGDRMEKFNPDGFKLVLVDEAHHIVAPGYLDALRHFGLEEKRESSPILVGVSATFSRFDGLRLGAAIDEIVYHKDYVEMIEGQWLSDVVFTTVASSADISKVRNNKFGDFQTSELSRAVNTDHVNEITVRSWLAKAADRKSTLIFCVDLDHVSGLTRAFRDRGIDARFVTGETPKVERSERLEAFRQHKFLVLINCGVFTEGTDIPNIDCVVLARPTRSRNLLVQMIGRGMRLHKGKKNCHIIDMVSSLETGIVTTPTLFGLEPGEVMKEASVEDMKSIKDRKEEEKKRAAEVYSETPSTSKTSLAQAPNKHQRIYFTEYTSVFDLISDTSGEQHIRALSQYAWVQVGPDRFILSGPTGSYIRLEKDGDANSEVGDREIPMYSAVEVRALRQLRPPGSSASSSSPWATPRKLLSATIFPDAVHGCDSYAGIIFPHKFIARNQRWRQNPATEGQLKFLNKMRKEDDQLEAGEVTMGKAADMITKIKHGARGQFAKLDAARRSQERQILAAEKKKEALKLRERVAVGPLIA